MRLKRYQYFYLHQVKVVQTIKQKEIRDFQLEEFRQTMLEGRKHNFVDLYLKNKSSINENYSFILENKEILSEVKLRACAKMFREGQEEIRNKVYEFLVSNKVSQDEIRYIMEASAGDFFRWVGDGIKKMGDWISDKARSLWKSVDEYIIKPGLDALKSFCKQVFGEEVVARIEAIGKAVVDKLDALADKAGDIWDKTIETMKDLAKKIGEVCKNIYELCRNFFKESMSQIVSFAMKCVPGINKIPGMLSKIGVMKGKTAADPAKLESEYSTAVEDWKTVFKKKDTGGGLGSSKEDTENVINKSGQNLVGAEGQPEGEGQSEGEGQPEVKKENQSLQVGDYLSKEDMMNSLIGSMAKNKLNETKLVYLNEVQYDAVFESEENHEDDKHKTSKGIKKWIHGIIGWVLSPLGKLGELISELGSRVAAGLGKWLSGGLGKKFDAIKSGKLREHLSSYKVIPLLASFITGAVIDGISIYKHASHGHEGHAEQASQSLFGKGLAELNKAEHGTEVAKELGKEAVEKGKEIVKDVKDKAGEVIKKVADAATRQNASVVSDYRSFSKINESEDAGAEVKSGMGKKIIAGIGMGVASAIIAYAIKVIVNVCTAGAGETIFFVLECISMGICIMGGVAVIIMQTEIGKALMKTNPALKKTAEAFDSFCNFITGHSSKH